MPVLGMKGSGNFSTDERPKNYRETINKEGPSLA